MYIYFLFTQLPETGHHVDKGGDAIAEWLGQVGPEVVSQGEQVVGQIHAVVVLDGCKLRELQQVLSECHIQRRTTQTARVRAESI